MRSPACLKAAVSAHVLPMDTNIYLIRHGEAYSNVRPTVAGMQGDRGLTPLGILQAKALAQRLASKEIQADVLYASTLPRARMTAEIVAEGLGLPINWDDELHELRPGEADGLSIEEARKRYPDTERFLIEQFAPVAPGGESWAGFLARVGAELERIIVRHKGQTVVAVTHGGVIEASFFYLLDLGAGLRTRAAFHVNNTAITHWRRRKSSRAYLEWLLVAHNDYRHLVSLAHEQIQAAMEQLDTRE